MTDDEIHEIAAQLTADMHAEAPGFRIIPAEEFDLRFARAIRLAALEEAANAIEPRNPSRDWTEYAKIRAEAVAAIRALAASEPKKME